MADCETEAWSESNLSPKLKMINAIMVDNDQEVERKSFLSVNGFINWCEEIYKQEEKSFRIYFHNLDFDAKYIMKTIMQRYNLDFIRNQSMLSIACRTKSQKFRYSKKKGKYHPYITHFEFRDSLILFYHLSVETLGKCVNLPKIKFTNYDESPTNPDYQEYCYRDCEIVIKAMQFLRDMFQSFGLYRDIEEFPLTLPALSFMLFKQKNERFMEIKEDSDGKIRKRNRIFSVHPKTNEYFRSFYFGGRCEVFDMKVESAGYCDINGLYQFIMDNNRMPIPEYKYYTKESFMAWKYLKIDTLLTDSTLLEADKIFAVECEIDDWWEKPVFCERVNGKQMFRKGLKRVLLQREEYQFCLNSHIPIVRLYKIHLCREWDYLFKYFEDIYKLRKKLKAENNPAEKLVKLPPNATYGKLGQYSTRTNTKAIKTVDLTAEAFIQLRDNAKNYWLLDECMIVSNDIDVKFADQNLALASRITALARLHLYSKFQIFQERGCCIKYCDTDSIVIPLRQIPLVMDLMSEESGGFKIEEEFQSFLSLAPKEYLFLRYIEKNFCGMNVCEQAAKIKGCTRGKMDDLYFGSVRHVRPMKFQECLNRDKKFESAVLVEKSKRSFYDKRVILEDYSSRPLFTTEITADNKEPSYSALRIYFRENYKRELMEKPEKPAKILLVKDQIIREKKRKKNGDEAGVCLLPTT